MRTAIALALLGALASAPVLAAGYEKGQQRSGMEQQGQQQQSRVDQQTARQLQQALRDQGYDPGQIDGRWGQRSQQAMRQFEQDRGLQADGQPDQQSLAALGVEGGPQQAQTPGERQRQSERQRGEEQEQQRERQQMER